MSSTPKKRRFQKARDTLTLTLHQRCFYLFCALLALIVTVPFLEESTAGRVALNGLSLLVLIAGAAAIGRGATPLVMAGLLAFPAAALQIVALFYDMPGVLVLSWAFSAAFYFLLASYLLTYVLRREVLTMDKLYGAAAAFLLLAVLWTYLYAILLVFHPGALTMNAEPISSAPFSTLMFFSVATLTSTGMSDVLPLHPIARMLCSLQMITGVLFITVLIARPAGTYPPERSQ